METIIIDTGLVEVPGGFYRGVGINDPREEKTMTKSDARTVRDGIPGSHFNGATKKFVKDVEKRRRKKAEAAKTKRKQRK